MHEPRSISTDAATCTVALVTSRYHAIVTDALRIGAREAWAEAGGRTDRLLEIEAPGTFELPVLALAAARRPDVDAVVALGCVIQGETTHDQHINAAVSQGLQHVALQTGKPVAFGVLTVRLLEQAIERAGGCHGNKGREAMEAAIAAAAGIVSIRSMAEGD